VPVSKYWDGLENVDTAAGLRIVRALLFFLVYIGLDAVSYIGPITPFAITPWNPTVGLCVAVTALYGPRTLLLILVAPLLADAVNRGFPLGPLYSVWVGILIAAETALITFGARHMMRRFARGIFEADEIRLLITALPSALVIASLHVGSLVALRLLPSEQFFGSIGHLWVGDIIGVLIVTPFCFLLLKPGQRQSFALTRVTETVAQVAAVLVTLWLIFGLHQDHANEYFYLLFLPMIWIVLRYGVRGAIVMNVFVQGAMLLALLQLHATTGSIVLFQAMLAVFVISGLTLGWTVDQRKAATQNLRAREEKLAASLTTAATSELAGTLAHELSHPIGAISNYVAALNHVSKTSLPDAPTQSILLKLNQEVKRATDTLHHLRDFFRTGSLALQETDLADLVRDCASLFVTRLTGQAVIPQLILQAGPTMILADRIQLHAVIHNLLINAADALEPIAFARQELRIGMRRDGAFAVLTVEDSGTGVAQDIRENIFDGLTTTKKDGLGLGLSICRSIVRAHGGAIALEDSTLGGARFVVTLPLIQKTEHG
jgi:two-component system sensor kinase FixL